MKKLLALILCLAMCLSACFALVACGETQDDVNPDNSGVNQDSLDKVTFEDSFGFIIKNLEINMGVDMAASLKVLELYVSKSTDGFIGGGVGKIEVSGTSPTSLDAALILKDNQLYANVALAASGVEQNVVINIDVERVLAYAIESSGASLEAVMGYVEGDLEADVEKFKNWIADELIPALGNTDAFLPSDEDIATVSAFFKTFGSNFIKTEAVGSDTKLSLDLSILSDWFSAMKSKKGNEFIDYVLGEGVYADIKAATPGILSFTVGDLVTEFKKNGGSIEELEAAINSLIILCDAPEGTTLKSLIAMAAPEFEGSVEDFLLQDDIASLSLNILPMFFTKAEADYEEICEYCMDIATHRVVFDGENYYAICSDCLKDVYIPDDYVVEPIEKEPVVETEPMTFTEIMEQVFSGLESCTIAELAGLDTETLSTIEASLSMAASSVNLELVVDSTSAIKSIKYGIDMSSLAEGGMVLNMNVNRTANGAVGSVEMKQAGVTMLKCDMEAKIGGSGYYSKSALENSVSILNKADAALASQDLKSMIVNSAYGNIETAEDIYEDGKIVGVSFMTSSEVNYTVYYDSCYANMVMCAQGYAQAQLIYYCNVSYKVIDGYENENEVFHYENAMSSINVTYAFEI